MIVTVTIRNLCGYQKHGTPEVRSRRTAISQYFFCAAWRPFILNAVITETHLERNASIANSTDLGNNIYVDSILCGTENACAAIKYYKESIALMKSCGFTRRSWTSNFVKIRMLAKTDNVLDPNSNVNILGLRWQTDSDTVTYTTKNTYFTDNVIRKREVIRATSSWFDALGYWWPFCVRVNLFTQDLWKRNLTWDEPFSDELSLQWNNILSDSNACSDITINRRYFPDNVNYADDHELHVFVDASTKAYGAAGLLRFNEQTLLVTAKTRIAPIKELTVSRLELLLWVLDLSALSLTH